jgi:heme/copper-type cytochrome/quinol oxidase subunit 3
MAAGCLALLVLLGIHYLAQLDAQRLRGFILGLWTVIALGMVFVFGHLLEFSRIGSYSPKRALTLAFAALAMLFLTATVAGSWSWLIQARQADRR